MERDLYWNSWEIVHPFPIVAYEDGANAAFVRYGGREATLSASFRRDRDADRLDIKGFAARFPKGRRIWDAQLEFLRKPDENEWSFWQVYLFDGCPYSGSPPQIIGFLKDYPAKDRGLGGTDKRIRVRYRSRAGLPNGPSNAADLERSKAWAYAESLWADEDRNPLETAQILGLSVKTLFDRLGTPAHYARLFRNNDERADA